MARAAVADGSAFRKLRQMVEAQGGEAEMLDRTELFEKAGFSHDVRAAKKGFISRMDTEKCGLAAVLLGAGRAVMDSRIDHSAGILVHKKTGEPVEAGEKLATLYTNDESAFPAAAALYESAVTLSEERPAEQPLIYAAVDRQGVRPF